MGRRQTFCKLHAQAENLLLQQWSGSYLLAECDSGDVLHHQEVHALSHDLLMIEASYTALAALLVGAIIGGLTGKLVLPLSMTHGTSS